MLNAGIKVTVACANSNGQVTMSREETTNWFGNYVMKFDGSPDLSGCYAQVSGSGQGSTSCSAAAGPAQNLRLMFRMFDMEMYTVDPLLTQPAQPMSFCPRSTNPVHQWCLLCLSSFPQCPDCHQCLHCHHFLQCLLCHHWVELSQIGWKYYQPELELT